MTCTSCRGRCPSRDACNLPEPTPAPRMQLPRMFRPTFDVDGPHRPPRRRFAPLRALRVFFTFLHR